MQRAKEKGRDGQSVNAKGKGKGQAKGKGEVKASGKKNINVYQLI